MDYRECCCSRLLIGIPDFSFWASTHLPTEHGGTRHLMGLENTVGAGQVPGVFRCLPLTPTTLNINVQPHHTRLKIPAWTWFSSTSMFILSSSWARVFWDSGLFLVPFPFQLCLPISFTCSYLILSAVLRYQFFCETLLTIRPQESCHLPFESTEFNFLIAFSSTQENNEISRYMNKKKRGRYWLVCPNTLHRV